ncbi:hypothetical protein [Brooklawnia cerclae]|uniref:Lipoprotein n=1 Tax=Brooklawnia cerclae TaxID=349934 RepID=A0ABX0SB57_9ACTN|nr:hypothetical protein [Brooklawnia cerclae]NIH55618.1 hypothetical protein [Brooklawnia cerclae]
MTTVFRATLASVVSTCYFLTACSSTEQPDLEPLPPISDYVPSDWDIAKYESNLESLATEYKLQDLPDVAIVRWVDPEDSIPLMVECLQAAGVDVVQTDTSSYTVEAAPGQEDSVHLATYVCTAQYPTRMDIDRPLSDLEMKAVYDHLVDEWLPCASDQGYEGLSKPSFEVYARSLSGETVDPVYEELSRKYQPSDEELQALMEACPLRPSGFRSYQR